MMVPLLNSCQLYNVIKWLAEIFEILQSEIGVFLHLKCSTQIENPFSLEIHFDINPIRASYLYSKINISLVLFIQFLNEFILILNSNNLLYLLTIHEF